MYKRLCKNGVYLLEVVRTVNHVYAAIVRTVVAAKSHPNLYVYMWQWQDKRKPGVIISVTYQDPANQ